jgi:hypothetical protein
MGLNPNEGAVVDSIFEHKWFRVGCWLKGREGEFVFGFDVQLLNLDRDGAFVL